MGGQNFAPVSFKRDPFGRRIYKSSSSTTSVYAYDGDKLVEETNPSGAVVARPGGRPMKPRDDFRVPHPLWFSRVRVLTFP